MSTKDDFTDKLEDVNQASGFAGFLMTLLLGLAAFGLIAVVLNAVEDTTGINVDLASIIPAAFDVLSEILHSMLNSIGDVLT